MLGERSVLVRDEDKQVNSHMFVKEQCFIAGLAFCAL